MSEVLVLQHAAPEGPAAIGDALAARGIGMRSVRIDRGEAVPSSLEGASGLLVMGGPMSVYDASRLPHLADEMRLIGRALKEGAPILGVCLGSQLLAASLGARVVPSGRKEIGWHEVRLAAAAREDTLWDKVGNSFQGFHWHGDVFDLPDRALPLASSAMTPLQAFRWGSNAYGLLFHLEVGPVQVRDMTHSFRDELASAGIPEGPILDGIERHAPSLQRIGAQVFGRWARIVDPQLKASG